MRHDVYFLDEKNTDIIAYSLYHFGDTNKSEIERMKKILSRAIKAELTDKQRECLSLYYFKGMRMREIARLLSLSPSTVSRHIKAAKRRLCRIAEYYGFPQEMQR